MAARPQIYCGNENIAPEGKVLGTKSQCMRKGVGVGLFHIAPGKYGISQERIDIEKNRQGVERAARYRRLGIPDLYCGDGEPSPGQVEGDRFKCLKRGIGVGMHVLAPERYNVNYLKNYDLSVQDIYMFARKLNVPLRGADGRGELISIDTAREAIARSLQRMGPIAPVAARAPAIGAPAGAASATNPRLSGVQLLVQRSEAELQRRIEANRNRREAAEMSGN